jgi:hypothetical protein
MVPRDGKGVGQLDARKRVRVGTWNVRSLTGTGSAKLLIDEIRKAGISLMGLQEVRWLGAGETRIGDHTLLWSGPPEGQPRQGGVALVLDKRAGGALLNWHPVNS